LILIAFCILITGIAAYYAWDSHVRNIQEATYQATLRSYSTNLKPGMTRKAVEENLRSRGVIFQQRDAASDLILIGKGEPDWVCSEKNE
jgi:cell division protein YceG involved in septum cleavage